MRNIIIKTITKTITETREHGEPQGFVTSMIGGAMVGITKVLFKGLLKDVKKRFELEDVNLNVTLIGENDLAAMQYKPETRTIDIPVINIINVLTQYADPRIKTFVYEQTGELFQPYEIIKELFNHEIGHAADTELTTYYPEMMSIMQEVTAFNDAGNYTAEIVAEILPKYKRLAELCYKSEEAAMNIGIHASTNKKLFTAVNKLNMMAYHNLYDGTIAKMQNVLEHTDITTHPVDVDKVPTDLFDIE